MDHGMGQGADRADRADRAGRTDGERYQGMDRRENAELYAAFEALLDAGPEPPLPSVTDAAVAGGRRIRRRRTAVALAGALVVAVCGVTTAVNVADSRPDPVQQPLAPPTPTQEPTEAPTPVATPEPAPG
ncbi:Hypothetical protein XNRR2_3276 [Streptomyces albidoflavus]|uniref:hypothetical protein n=1 Tax=Streptomyces albidoflavus TaxID=1886 RepID=UPI0001AECAD3|nr:hypothetical protein [Streptomyces albidoflavus]PKA35893.1 hypothetical protein SM8_017630 [Streptomyces sp. SM8]SCE10341.1 hypothetical protein GA0115236_13603 [Streptomyces sp. IgraMP-1]AGI89619.1 Hypothetical protein XNR_3276 [Streptomyces albidoflavus]QLP93472.1 Hypothetical protein XNRR2_3276 [Streptomyces albidoflavus]RZE20142.1 hypothetical protein C0Q93_16975 [Streptomyces albidoflavus]